MTQTESPSRTLGSKSGRSITAAFTSIHATGAFQNRDKNFQGYGTFTTASTGEYRFRTIKPVPYSGRTAHIHLRVNRGGREVLTTQVFINGFPQNNSDMVLGGIRDLVDRELVLVDFKPVKGSKIGELSARFDIVVGVTPSDRPEARD